jgi:opacity protein-like surface antigen
MKWIFSRVLGCIVASVTMFSFSNCCVAANAHVIYGLKNAKVFTDDSQGDVYIEAGSFINKPNADKYKKSLQAKTTYPVKIIQHAKFYSVLIGPVSSAFQVRQLANKELSSSAHQHIAHHSYSHTHCMFKQYKDVVIPISEPKWFVALGGGVQYPQFKSRMTVNNGSGFPPPFNQDVYATNTPTQPVVAVTAGRRWVRDTYWVPAYSIGLRYEHLFQVNVGDTVTQYSSPEFTNYRSRWGVATDLLLAYAKINLFNYGRLSPYVSGGVGTAFNSASAYGETALPGVTARTNPGFGSKRTSRFAFNAGIGVDYRLTREWMFSLGYEYLNLGSVVSGSGTNSWAGESLHLGTYHSNQLLLSVNYLFDS